MAVIGNEALVPLEEVEAALCAAFELGNDDLCDLGHLPARWWSSRVCFGKSELLASNYLDNDDLLHVPRPWVGYSSRGLVNIFFYIKPLFFFNGKPNLLPFT